MLIVQDVRVGRPAGEVERRLIAGISQVQGMGGAAYRHGENLYSKVGPARPLAKEVVVAVGRPTISRSGVSLPVTWRATGAESLFPRLDGELVVAPLDGDATSLVLRATYQPPFGWIGDMVDRLLLARIARQTVTDWLDRVAQYLESRDSTGASVGAEPTA